MNGEGTVSSLRATVARTLEEIGRTQSAFSLAMDRAQQSRDILGRGFADSNRDEIAAALAAMDSAREIAEQAIAATVIAQEQLTAYAGTL